MKFSSDLVRSSTKNLVLAALAEEEMYGYQIMKTIREKSHEAFDLGEGSLYPVLHSLEKSHAIVSRWVTQTGSPDRKYYKLTRKGRKLLRESVREWNDFSKAVNSLLKHVKTFHALEA